MAFDAHKNFAVSAVATAPSPAASGTSLVVTGGHGTRFPAVPFNATVWPANTLPDPSNAEIVRVTNISTDTLTIAREQEGTSARTIVVGDQIAATITAKTLTDVEVTAPIEQTTSATGAQNNFDIDGPNTVLRCTGAAPVFTGFTVDGAAPKAGDRVLILCLGTTAKVTNQDTGSTAANRIITPSTNGQIVGVNGAMLCVYDDTTDRWREYLIDPGAPVAVAFSAGDYTAASSMTWTVAEGDVQVDTFVQRGTQLALVSTINTTTVGGTPAGELRKALPAGFTAVTGEQWQPIMIGYDNNVAADVLISVNSAQSNAYLRIRRKDAGNWAAATNTTYIYIPGFTFLVN
jgi:hypothetical protein